MFNKIGHSRIFLINQLLQIYKKPVIYLDNDTLLTHKCLSTVVEMCSGPNVYGYIEEIWVKFSELYTGYKYQCVFDINDSFYKNCLNLNPINNGIQIYPYNANSLAFAADVVTTYIKLEDTCKSHFHDMLAFSMIWYKYINSKVIAAGLFYETGSKAYGTERLVRTSIVPAMIHYYFGKYENMTYIKTVNQLLIQNFLNCQILHLVPSQVQGNYLINYGLLCGSCSNICKSPTSIGELQPCPTTGVSTNHELCYML